MTIWDSTHAELRDALKRAGRNPLDDAHVLTLAVEAIDDLAAVDLTHVTIETRDEEVGELEETVSRLEREADDHVKDQKRAEDQISDLKADLLAAQQDLKAARRDLDDLGDALNGDEHAQAQMIARLTSELADERAARIRDGARLRDLARDWASRLRRFAADLERPRAKKDYSVRGMRLNADEMDRWAGPRAEEDEG